MFKHTVAFLVVFAASSRPTLLAADGGDWKPESEEAALQILKECRAAIARVPRIEVDCVRSIVNEDFADETRSVIRVQYQRSVGCLWQIRAGDSRLGPPRRTERGEVCSLRPEAPQTWLLVGGVLTRLDDDRRAYLTGPIGTNDWLFGLFLRDPLFVALPPWLDSSIDWKQLTSRFRVEQARSRSRELLIKFVPLERLPPSQPAEDDRLSAAQCILMDRDTLLPKQWWMSYPRDSRQQAILYRRFDLNPPPRELKVDLTGYKKAFELTRIEDIAPEKEPRPVIPEGVAVLARVIFAMLF